jgi:regulatory protein YycI of two-component signal transduction system YycFG
MDLSPTAIIVVFFLLLVMLAWAYFDFRNTDSI